MRVVRLGFDVSVSPYSGSLPAGGNTVQDTLNVQGKFTAATLSNFTLSNSAPAITFTATGLGRTSTIGMTDGANMYITNSAAGNLYIGNGTTTYVQGNLQSSGTIDAQSRIYSRASQSDNNYTTAALWTQSFNTTTTGIAFHISNVVGKFLEMRTNGVLYWDNGQVWTSGTLTNLNQLSNGPGYISITNSYY